MASNKFTEDFPGFKTSDQGKALLVELAVLHKKYLRAMITAETTAPEDKGKVQLLQKLAKDLFSVDLLDEKVNTD